MYVIQRINHTFAFKDLGEVDYFLDIEVKHLKDGSLLPSQAKYIKDLITKTKIVDYKPISTPILGGCKLSKEGGVSMPDPLMCRSVVGTLQYATITRPEISFSVNKVCQFMILPTEDHQKIVKRILRYLKGILDHGLLLHPAKSLADMKLYAFCDTDWASDPDDRRSTSGYTIFFGPNLVSWWYEKQNMVARSSAEVAYRSLTLTIVELVWMQSLLSELQIKVATLVVFCDNQSTVALCCNPVLHSRTKHIELNLFFVKEKVQSKDLVIVNVSAREHLADVLTKALPKQKFIDFRQLLSVVPASSL